jgi:hypothetical protein
MKLVYPFIIILFFGCYTQKEASKDLNKAKSKYPELTAKFTRDNFPCKTTDSSVVYDTVYRDVEVLCPPPTYVYTTDTLYKNKVDTIKVKGNTQYVKTLVRVPVKQETITKWYEDSSKIFLIMKDLEKCKAEKDKYVKKNELKRSFILWLIIALLMSILFNIFLLRK